MLQIVGLVEMRVKTEILHRLQWRYEVYGTGCCVKSPHFKTLPCAFSTSIFDFRFSSYCDEKRRDGELKKDQKLSKKAAGEIGKGASSIEATKETVPVVLKLRLFVGGLGPTVGASDLQQRFAPLGTVHRIDLVEGKKGWDAEEEALQRGFAYVDFEASSEASLRKLFSAVSANLLFEYHRAAFFCYFFLLAGRMRRMDFVVGKIIFRVFVDGAV